MHNSAQHSVTTLHPSRVGLNVQEGQEPMEDMAAAVGLLYNAQALVDYFAQHSVHSCVLVLVLFHPGGA